MLLPLLHVTISLFDQTLSTFNWQTVYNILDTRKINDPSFVNTYNLTDLNYATIGVMPVLTYDGCIDVDVIDDFVYEDINTSLPERIVVYQYIDEAAYSNIMSTTFTYDISLTSEFVGYNVDNDTGVSSVTSSEFTNNYVVMNGVGNAVDVSFVSSTDDMFGYAYSKFFDDNEMTPVL